MPVFVANAEDLHWKVERRYPEFYALESKLTEFHGEFEDAKLPAKAKLFMGRGLDVMQSKIQPFEEYLKTLLQKPSLKGSDILFTFLTSQEEFTAAAMHLGLGKMIKNVPLKLTKEKGQALTPFMENFIASTQPQPPKPSYNAVYHDDHDFNSVRPIPHHVLFGNNLGVANSIKLGHCNKYFSNLKPCNKKGVFDTLVYLGKMTAF